MDREVAASTVAQGVDGRLEEREPRPRVRTPAPGPAPGGPLRRRGVSHRKMKKFIRYLRLKPQSPSDRDEHAKRRRRYEADFTLEPFAGLTPEYMEMSTWRVGGGPVPAGGHCCPPCTQRAPSDGALSPAAASPDGRVPTGRGRDVRGPSACRPPGGLLGRPGPASPSPALSPLRRPPRAPPGLHWQGPARSAVP